MIAVLKSKPPAPLFAVAWIPQSAPEIKERPETIKAALKVGGRFIDGEMSKSNATQIANCLNIGEQGLPGEYIAVS